MENDSIKITNYSIFYYNYSSYIFGKAINLTDINKEIKLIDDKKKFPFLEKISNESKNYLYYYDNAGLLNYLDNNFQKANEHFENSLNFKKKMFDANILGDEEWSKSKLISIYNQIEIFQIFPLSSLENLIFRFKDSKPSSVKSFDEYFCYNYYDGLLKYLSEDYLNSIKKVISLREDREFNLKKFNVFVRYKKNCLLERNYEKIENISEAINYSNKILEDFDNGDLYKGENYLKLVILRSNSFLLENLNKTTINLNPLKNLLNQALNYIREIEKKDIMSILTLVKFQILILSKLIYISIIKHEYIESQKDLKDLQNLIKSNELKIENITFTKIIYLNNKMIIVNKLNNFPECKNVIEEILQKIRIDIGPADININILNNVYTCLASNINEEIHVDDLIQLLKEVTEKKRMVFINKLLSNFIFFDKEILSKHSKLFTSDIKIIQNLKKILQNIEEFTIKNYDDLNASYFLFNYLVMIDRKINLNLGILNDLQKISTEDILRILYKNVTDSSFNFILQKNIIEFYLKVVYMYALNKFKQKKLMDSLEVLNQTLIQISKFDDFTSCLRTFNNKSNCHKLAGDILFNLKKFDESINHYKIAYEIYLRCNNTKDLAVVSSNIALIHILHTQNFKEATINIEYSIELFEKNNELLKSGKAKELLNLLKKESFK